jgi:IS30 family transposase
MKDGKTQSQIATLLNRHKSTICRGLTCNTSNRGCYPKQAGLPVEGRTFGSRNAAQIATDQCDQIVDCLLEQLSNVRITNQVVISNVTIYRHVYADMAVGGSLNQQLRCQKKRKKRYANGSDRIGQIVDRGPTGERPAHNEIRIKVSHREVDTTIGAHHKQAVVTLVERKSSCAVLAKAKNKKLILASSINITKIRPLALLVKTLTFDNGKEFAEHNRIDMALQSTTYFAGPFAS